ncbi:hypothetical protein [Nocardia farcinica]|uniref:hypothetical protein n=1 Tax=Nocardia farcinica TaxID=37329 RepID=UPI002454962C|nr:hypothetical protein [Nocardia farcinica]
MSDHTAALLEACRFARRHGIEIRDPEDFAVQSRPPGIHAVYVDADAAVVVVIPTGGEPTFGLADLDWLHFPDHVNGTEDCAAECGPRRPQTIVHLPGDEEANT